MCGNVNRIQVRNLSNILGVQSIFADESNLFQDKVISYFKSSNKAGLTPNPCIICNEHVKFKILFDYTISNSFDYIATGHYARVANSFGRKRIARGVDSTKEQSYVLARVPNHIIDRLILPLSNAKRSKSELIVKYLPTAKTSQDACFASGDTKGWIKENIGFGSPGLVFSTMGEELGKHEGLLAYTIGQRSGLRLGDGPWYVVSRDFNRNTLVVGRKSDAMKNRFSVTDLQLDIKENLSVMTRYRSKAVPCIVDGNIVETETPVFAPTPGQFAVFYVEDVVVGSGIIVSSIG